MKPSRLRLLLLAAAMQASAAGAAPDDWRFSGFGTLGAAWFSSKDGDYVTSQARGPGRSESLAYNLDSVLAGQADWRASPDLAASMQVVMVEKPNRSWTPFVRLANLRYQLGDETYIRVGLLPSVQMLSAEYRWVNFGNPYPRPPVEVYRAFGQNDARRFGVDASRAWKISSGLVRVQVAAVTERAHLPRANAADVDPLRSEALVANLDWENEGWKARVSLCPWGRYWVVTQSTQSLLATLRQLDPANGRYFDDTANVHSIGISLAYDSNRWLFMGEAFAREVTNSWNRSTRSGYITVGHHFGGWLPYATLARLYTGKPQDRPNSNAATATLVDMLYRSQNLSQKSIALGVAYDVRPGVQLKTQLDFIRPDSDSSGTLTNLAPTYDRAHPPTRRLASVSVDFVF